MLNIKNILAVIPFVALMALPRWSHAATPIDADKSTVEWVGTKVTGQHNGTLQILEGSVTWDDGKLVSGRLVLDMTSIRVSDIKDPKWNTKLENHLKNDDFFAVDKYPRAIFYFDSASPLPGAKENSPNYHFKGELTIKDITHALEFDAEILGDRSKARARGNIIVNRAKYDIRYKSGSFFEGLGDKTIHDEFTISFDVLTQ